MRNLSCLAIASANVTGMLALIQLSKTAPNICFNDTRTSGFDDNGRRTKLTTAAEIVRDTDLLNIREVNDDGTIEPSAMTGRMLKIGGDKVNGNMLTALSDDDPAVGGSIFKPGKTAMKFKGDQTGIVHEFATAFDIGKKRNRHPGGGGGGNIHWPNIAPMTTLRCANAIAA